MGAGGVPSVSTKGGIVPQLKIHLAIATLSVHCDRPKVLRALTHQAPMRINMSTSSSLSRIVLSVASLIIFMMCSCTGRSNQVVGDSNGWTIEEYNKALQESDKEASAPSP